MSDNILQAIDAIASAISGKDCCGGSSGGGCIGYPSGSKAGSGGILDDDQSPGQPSGPGTPPSSWGGTSAEYDAYKCKAANYIFESTKGFYTLTGAIDVASLSSLSGAAVGSAILAYFNANMWVSAGGVMGGLLVALPIWALEAIVVLLVALVVIGVGVGVLLYFNDIATELESNKSDIVCGLYNATSVDEARTVLSDALADAETNLIIDPPYNTIETLIRTAFFQIIGYVLPNTFLNQLFEQSNNVDTYTPTNPVDCSSCGGGALEIINGTLLSGDLSGDFELEAISSSSGGCPRWQTYILPGTYTGNTQFRVQILDGTTPKCCGGSPCVAFMLETDTQIYQHSTFDPPNGLGTDFTECWLLPGGQGLLVRTTAKHRLMVTKLGGC